MELQHTPNAIRHGGRITESRVSLPFTLETLQDGPVRPYSSVPNGLVLDKSFEYLLDLIPEIRQRREKIAVRYMKRPDGRWKGSIRIDMSGKTFGSWKVLERVGTTGHNTAWLCQCRCGTINIVDYNQLKRDGLGDGCRACRFLGKRFGKLVIVGLRDRNDMVECRCDCGKKVIMKYGLLESRLSGVTDLERDDYRLSCGCMKRDWRKNKHIKDIVGVRFGKLLVINYAGPIMCKRKGIQATAGTKWLCRCDCGNKKVFQKGQLVSKTSTDCGCESRIRIKSAIGLAISHPDIARRWHPTRNTLTPEEVTYGSGKRVWWVCKEGHEWEAMVMLIVRASAKGNTGCPHCRRKNLVFRMKNHRIFKTTKTKKAA